MVWPKERVCDTIAHAGRGNPKVGAKPEYRETTMEQCEIHEQSPGRLRDYLDFFDHTAFTDNHDWAGCYCYFPYHDPAQSDWHERTGEQNRSAITDCILNGKAQGFLAYFGDRVVGWCNAAPRHLYPSLAGLPGDPNKTGAIFCFVGAPELREKGIASQLLAAACESLQAQGMELVIAKPVDGAETAAGNFQGPLSMYLNAGFSIVHKGEKGNVYVEKRLAG